MRSRSFSLTLVVLLSLFFFIPSIFAQGSKDTTAVDQSKQIPLGKESGADAATVEEDIHDDPIKGVSDVVQEALEILRPLEGIGPAYISRPKPATLLEGIIHYAKVIFRFLFMNGPSESKISTTKLDPLLTKALPILKAAAAQEDPDALFLLGEMSFYGNFSHPRNYADAFDYFDTLAVLTGNATAQNMVGFMYATGLGGIERDQGKALLYHTFAADQGDTRSEMTTAFRHHSGIGTPRDCDKAAHYYKRVADKAMAYWKAGPPGGRYMMKNSYRWADEDGGLYGEGASFSSAGANAYRDHMSMEDAIEYLDMEAQRGDLKATYTLGKLYYDGTRSMKRNFRKAQKHFTKVARAYWQKDGTVNPSAPKDIEKVAGKSAAHIGRMFLRGEGMEASYEKAHTWFKRGVSNGDALSQYHIGLIYLEGLGVPQDAVKAASFLKAAAEQDNAAAQSTLGTLFLDQGDVETAVRYFELAARHGYMEAFYYLAELAEKGIGRDRHCGVATAYYKIVSEKAEDLHSSFPAANAAYESSDLETALILSMMAAEQGYESAQVNVAYILDSQKSAFDLREALNPFAKKRSSGASLKRIKPLALVYFTRSAKQSNVDSLLKAGDYYLSGTGLPDSKPDYEAASTCYHTAAEGHHSAQAFWNLGWMHENGIAVSQDFPMAKRFYDLALETNSEAYLPVKLALCKLRLRSWWNDVTGGSINSIQDDTEDSEANPRRTFSEWVSHFWENAEEQAAAQHAAMMEDLDMDLGDAMGPHDPMPGGDGDYYEDFDDGILESLLIIGLATVLAALVFWRQQRQLQGQRRQREQQQRQQLAQQQQQQWPMNGNGADIRADGQGHNPHDEGDEAARQNGFFPDPGQPEFQQWVAGGIGH